MKSFAMAVLAYLLPSFPLAYVWHLILFKAKYDALQMYRPDVIIPFGLASMLIQAVLFGWVYKQAFAETGAPSVQKAMLYGAFGAALSWSFTTLAVAAKNVMVSVPDYLAIETGFTLVQWLCVAPLTVYAFRQAGK